MRGTTPIASVVENCRSLLDHLEKRDDILLLTTSTRYEKHAWDVPKTTRLARRVEARLRRLGKKVVLLDVAPLKIHECEGNISAGRGNTCGVAAARLGDKRKNPTGHHRCWASVNNKDDELYRITRELFKSRVVIFFVSVRWGQTNSVYQRLFERLSWIENRISTLGEKPIPQLKKLEAGMVLFGHNWNDAQVLAVQKQNFEWFGWKTPEALSFRWQYTEDEEVESPASYRDAAERFEEILLSVPA